VQAGGNRASKPIHAVIPFGAGQRRDVVRASFLEQMSSQLGQSIVVENRAGAGGTLGSALVARADLTATPCWCIRVGRHHHAHALSKLNYDIVRDFITLCERCDRPNVTKSRTCRS